MGVKIEVSTQQGQYVAGDVIQGSVNLIVNASKPEGSSAKELTLQLVGTATTSVSYIECDVGDNSVSKEKEESSDVFLSYEVQLACFDGKATTGTHSFPFSIMLPPGLYSSMKESKGRKDFCSIDYVLKAHLHRPGIIHRDAKATSEILVLSKAQEATLAVPVLAETNTQSVRSWGVFNKGSISIGFEADRSAVRVNDSLNLSVFAGNHSSVPVEAMHIVVEQVCNWSTKHQKAGVARIVASTVLTGDELGEIQNAAEGSDKRKKRAVADHDRSNLQQTRHELIIPAGSLHYLNAKHITVRNRIRVTLSTSSSMVTDPDVSVPLLVQPGLPVLGASAETNPVGVSPAEANAGGGLGLVSVPQHAVKPEFSCELPEMAPAK